MAMKQWTFLKKFSAQSKKESECTSYNMYPVYVTASFLPLFNPFILAVLLYFVALIFS